MYLLRGNVSLTRRKLIKALKAYFFTFMCGCVCCIVACRYVDEKAVILPDKVNIASSPIKIVDNVLLEELAIVNEEPTIEEEAKWVAKVMYGMVQTHSEDAQRAVVWCIINRVESSQFGSTIKEVCDNPSQWMGYSSDNPVLQDLYDVALETLRMWHEHGIRPVSNDFVFLDWSRDSITLLTTYGVNSTTRKWQVS